MPQICLRFFGAASPQNRLENPKHYLANGALVHHDRPRTVTVVTEDAKSAEARGVIMALEAALFTVEISDGERLPADELLVLLDNALLPSALYGLISLMPGRAVFPNVVLVVDNAEASGGLLAEGFRDVVERRDVVAALQAIVTGRPPVYLQHLRELIERKFLASFSRCGRVP